MGDGPGSRWLWRGLGSFRGRLFRIRGRRAFLKSEETLSNNYQESMMNMWLLYLITESLQMKTQIE